MKQLTKKTATSEEREIINDWLDYYECQHIRGTYYGIFTDKNYVNKVQLLDNMFEKYDSFLNKNETIYRGIRFEKRLDDNRYKIFVKNIEKAFKNSEIIKIDEAPSSFTRNKNVAFNEFAKADSDKFYSIVFKLIKRKNNELYIKEFAGKFAYQDEIVVKSHKSSYEIIDIDKKDNLLIIKLIEE